MWHNIWHTRPYMSLTFLLMWRRPCHLPLTCLVRLFLFSFRSPLTASFPSQVYWDPLLLGGPPFSWIHRAVPFCETRAMLQSTCSFFLFSSFLCLLIPFSHMYILLLAPPTPRLYRIAFLTPHVAPSSPVAAVAVTSPLHYTSHCRPHASPSPPLVQSSCSLFRHASTLLRSPSPCVCHVPPLRLSCAATLPRAAPRHTSPIVLPQHHGTRFGPAVNGGDSVVGGRAGWSVSAGASAGSSILSL